MNKLIEYLKNSRAELMKVVWPSRLQARNSTIVVIFISIGIGAFLGIIDFMIENFVFPYIIK